MHSRRLSNDVQTKVAVRAALAHALRDEHDTIPKFAPSFTTSAHRSDELTEEANFSNGRITRGFARDHRIDYTEFLTQTQLSADPHSVSRSSTPRLTAVQDRENRQGHRVQDPTQVGVTNRALEDLKTKMEECKHDTDVELRKKHKAREQEDVPNP